MITFKRVYETPRGLSDMMMTSDGEVLTGLHFFDSRKVAKGSRDCAERELPVFRETRRWLDEYFEGREPDFTPAYRIDGLTSFRNDVIRAMFAIPFGETATYGDIAAAIAKKRGQKKMSAQAVGGAVGWNPICIIIPCHRVIGAKGALVGYGGGIKNKIALLAHEAAANITRSSPASARWTRRARTSSGHDAWNFWYNIGQRENNTSTSRHRK